MRHAWVLTVEFPHAEGWMSPDVYARETGLFIEELHSFIRQHPLVESCGAVRVTLVKPGEQLPPPPKDGTTILPDQDGSISL